MKNKVKVLISIIGLLLIGIGIYLILNIGNKYENIRIISEDPSCGSPSRIIYNNKVYEISEENGISSIKYYNGKIYFYKSIGKVDIFSYTQAVNELKNIDSIFYEFGEIILDEENLTYSMKVEKQISYKEYENGDKTKIEYLIENKNEEYGLEITELIETIEDITILKKYKGNEYFLEFTKKDENNNVKWIYNTESGVDAEFSTVEIIEIFSDRIYIIENDTIVILNKEDGKVLKCNNDYDARFVLNAFCFDEEENLYIYTASSIDIINSKGELVTKINHKAPIITDGVEFDFLTDKELLIEGTLGRIVINLSNYSIEYAIICEYTEEDTLILRKTDGKKSTIWKYEDKGYLLGDKSVVNDKVYIVGKGKVTTIDVENGKVIWKNSDYKGKDYYLDYCFDTKENLYLYDDDNFKLYIIDKNGETVKIIDNFGVSIERYDTIGEEFRLRNNETELIIPCSIQEVGYAVLIINLKDYSITYENIEE